MFYPPTIVLLCHLAYSMIIWCHRLWSSKSYHQVVFVLILLIEPPHPSAMADPRRRGPRCPARDATLEAGVGVHLQEDAQRSRGHLSSKGTAYPSREKDGRTRKATHLVLATLRWISNENRVRYYADTWKIRSIRCRRLKNSIRYQYTICTLKRFVLNHPWFDTVPMFEIQSIRCRYRIRRNILFRVIRSVNRCSSLR